MDRRRTAKVVTTEAQRKYLDSPSSSIDSLAFADVSGFVVV